MQNKCGLIAAFFFCKRNDHTTPNAAARVPHIHFAASGVVRLAITCSKARC